MKLDEIGDSRTKILEILKRERCSVDELQKALGISPTAIRQHLSILEKDALVGKTPVRTGAGRPRYVYSLTEKAEACFPKAYEMLASSLITEIRERWGGEELLGVMEGIARAKGKEVLRRVEGETEEDKLRSAVKLINELGYYIDLEKEGESYIIKVHNCLFSNLIKEHDHLLCAYDHAFFQILLDPEIMREDSRAHGAEHCSFYLKKTKNGSPF